MSSIARTPAPAGPARLAVLDLARCLAIVLMVFAHLSDSLVAPSEWLSDFGQLYGRIRGITAPLFLLVSGWAFSAATLPKFADHRRFGPALMARLRRAAVLVFWGGILTLPWWAPGFPFAVRPELWSPFLSFGVLHCVAAGLLCAQLMIRLASSPRTFAVIALVAGLAALGLGPFVQSLAAANPAFPMRGAFFTASFAGGFPLLPWAGFFWLGSAFGAVSWTRRLSIPAIAGWAATASLVSLSLGAMLGAVRLAGIEPSLWAATTPALMFHRLGIVAAILSVLAIASPVTGRASPLLRIPSNHALTFYVGHMLIIWGVPSITGLHHRLGPTQSFIDAAMMTALCLAGIWILVGFAKRIAKWTTAPSPESSPPPDDGRCSPSAVATSSRSRFPAR